MTTKSRNLSIYARGLSRFEAMMWVFTRLTALAMYALILFAIIAVFSFIQFKFLSSDVEY